MKSHTKTGACSSRFDGHVLRCHNVSCNVRCNVTCRIPLRSNTITVEYHYGRIPLPVIPNDDATGPPTRHSQPSAGTSRVRMRRTPSPRRAAEPHPRRLVSLGVSDPGGPFRAHTTCSLPCPLRSHRSGPTSPHPPIIMGEETSHRAHALGMPSARSRATPCRCRPAAQYAQPPGGTATGAKRGGRNGVSYRQRGGTAYHIAP